MSKQDEKFFNQIGDKLRELRIKKGIESSERFAYKCGISRAGYQKVENGGNVSIRYLKKILDYHSMKLWEFFKAIE